MSLKTLLAVNGRSVFSDSVYVAPRTPERAEIIRNDYVTNVVLGKTILPFDSVMDAQKYLERKGFNLIAISSFKSKYKEIWERNK